MIRSYIFDELDKTLALVGVILSLTLTIWIKVAIDQLIYVTIGILCFLVCIGYLIIRRFFDASSIPSLEEIRCSNRIYKTLNILFFFLLTYSIISIYLRPDPYIRPLGYFISIALMAVIVADEILFLSLQKSHICFALCKIIIIGLSLEYSQILIFPSVVGVDPWWHQWFTLKILDNGYIPDGYAYSKLPLMHLIIGMTSLVTDLGYKMATMLSISFLQVICDALFVFLLGKFLISTKVGLLAALLLELASFHIHYGYQTIPNTMAVITILPIMFIIFKVRKEKPFIGTLIVMFLMGTLILTHTITTMFLNILFYAFWIGSEAYITLFYEEKTYQSVTLNISILFSIGMLGYWTYASGHIGNLARLIKWGFGKQFLADYTYRYISEIFFWERLFSYSGIFLFFSISFIGCFYMLSKQFRNSKRVISIIGGIVILCIAFIFILFGKNVIADRWFYFSQILLAIPLSLSILLIVGIFRNKFITGLLMSLIVFILSFIFILNPTANMDNRLFFPNSGIRFAYTESELHAIDTISIIWNGTIGGDWYCKYPFELQLNQEYIYIDDSFYARDFTDLQGIMIFVREEILKHPYLTIRGPIKLKYDIHIALDNQKFSHIYDCGSASSYLQP